MGEARVNNASLKMTEYAKYGELSKQIKNAGYEVKINGTEYGDNDSTKFTGGEELVLKKNGSENTYIYTIGISDDSIKATSWKIVTDTNPVGISLGDEIENSNGERFYVVGPTTDGSTLTSSSTVDLLAKYNLNKEGTVQAPNAVYTETGCAFSSRTYWFTSWETYYDSSDNGWSPSPKESSSIWTKTRLNLNNEAENVSGDSVTKAKEYGATRGGTGRLFTFEEVICGVTYNYIVDDNNYELDFGENLTRKNIILGKSNEQTENKSFLYYWIGSGYEGTPNGVFIVVGDNRQRLSSGLRAGVDEQSVGVRPVLTISKSAIQ